MNIGIIHYAVLPVVGGVEAVIGQHARLMAGAGHEVTLVAGRGEQTGPRIHFTRVPLADSRHEDILANKAELDAGCLSSRFGSLVDALLNQLAPAVAGLDVLIAHNVCSLSKNLPLTAALHHIARRPGGPRVILWHHDLAWTTPRYRSELHPGYPWDLLRTAWPGVTQVVVSAARQQELAGLMGIPADQVHVIPNGIDVAGFLQLGPLAQKLMGELHLDTASPLLLLPVRITPRKNIEHAVRVMAALRETYPQAALVVTGPPGPHNPANAAYFRRLLDLRKEFGLESTVHFIAEMVQDYLPDAVIAELYRLADALYLPSREEGFGIPILEAGISGIPIFCTEIPQLQELGRDLVTYFDPDEAPEQVAEKIVQALSQNPVFTLRQRVKNEYAWQRIYAVHIQPLLDRSGS